MPGVRAVNPINRNTPEIFWAKIDIRGPNDCWEWTKSIGSGGHGKLLYRGKNVVASRLAWELTNGPISLSTILVCHSCDNPKCCNPKHLWLGSSKDNSQDAVSKGRVQRGDNHYSKRHPGLVPKGDSHYLRKYPDLIKRGENHSRAIFSEHDIRNIRNMRKLGSKLATIADMYSTSITRICSIVKRRTWKHVQ